MPSLTLHGCHPAIAPSPIETDTHDSTATKAAGEPPREPSQPPLIHVTGRRRPPSLQVRLAEHNAARSPQTSEVTYGGCAGSKSFNAEEPSEIAHVGASSTQPTDYALTVPYVSQAGDRYGCWYACVRMIGHYYEAGPRLGHPQRYNSQTGEILGIGARNIEQLIKNENLLKVPLPYSQAFELEDFEPLLRRRGPIMFGWKSASGEGDRHMSLLVGISRERNTVIFHDPNPSRGEYQEMWECQNFRVQGGLIIKQLTGRSDPSKG